MTNFVKKRKAYARKKMVFFNIISYFFIFVKCAPVLLVTAGKLKFFNFQKKSARICARIGDDGRRPTFALKTNAYGDVVVMRALRLDISN